MKAKHWHIENGQVTPCSPFYIPSGSVTASTKAQATSLLLAQLEAIKQTSPRLVFRDGAWLMVWHNGHELVTESGYVNRVNRDGQAVSLSIGHAETLAKAKEDKAFAYYASESGQATRERQIASLNPDTIKANLDAQALSDAAAYQKPA